jgi:RNA polymerase-binding transcription factor DksA
MPSPPTSPDAHQVRAARGGDEGADTGVVPELDGDGEAGPDEASARAALEADRETALLRVRTLGAELDGIIADAVDTNADDEHDPEGSTVAFERAQATALVAEARSRVAEIDRALVRLADGTYTTCEVCGRPIPAERLAALASTRTCVTCAGAR